MNGNGARMYTITHAQLNSTKIATTNIIRSSREGTFAYAFTSPQTRLHSHSFLREGVRVIFKSFKNQTRIFRCVCTFTNWQELTQMQWPRSIIKPRLILCWYDYTKTRLPKILNSTSASETHIIGLNQLFDSFRIKLCEFYWIWPKHVIDLRELNWNQTEKYNI